MVFRKSKFIKKINNYIKELQFSNFYHQVKGALENYQRSNSSLWANTLCYFTTLSFIPLMAIAFSVGKWFQVDQHYLKLLVESTPMDEELMQTILGTAQNVLDNTRSGVIASVGFFSLAWVVISMFTTIEKALNSIWQIKRCRSFFRRVSDYSVVFMMLPFSVIGANVLTSLDVDIFYVQKLIHQMAPYLALWIFFTFFYMILPNTKVNLAPAIWSSFIVSFLLNQGNMLMIKLQIFITAYNRIYGSFSMLLLTLIWLKIVWFLILIGAHFIYIIQNRGDLGKINEINKLNFLSRYRIAKQILVLFIKNYLNDERPISSQEISTDLKIPLNLIREILEELRSINYISIVEDDSYRLRKYKLTINIEKITFEKLYCDMEKYGMNFSVENVVFDDKAKLIDYIREKDESDNY